MLNVARQLVGKSKKQVDFIMALLESGNIAYSCKVARVAQPTAYKWLYKENLHEEIQDIRTTLITDSLDRLKSLTTRAIDVILDIFDDKDCSKSVKLNASKTVIDNVLKLREQDEIIERLNALEAKFNDTKE